MAENPASWGRLEHLIDDALAEQEKAMAAGLIGFTTPRAIADRLREEDMIKPERTSHRGGTFLVEALPCPQCGNKDILGYYFITEEGKHQHTKYICTRWNSGAEKPCGWEGWTVPGWDDDEA